ncbi:epigen isoform X1 [Gadus morhua]|uniref:epigen isoform X1 n=1 Tax=Gadus morhua TaxID=8049 RepID=UPI0011B5114E|nr:proepiregulin-like isoform X1 [Gadus morhua]XP_030227311.1 proepiregulin-like isoform X1 [Gadus morhua]XP_030227312.1 proepiregulin-like isoform X1 [Gadus morhua]
MYAIAPILLFLSGLMLVWPSALSDTGAREHTAGSVSAYNVKGNAENVKLLYRSEMGQQRRRVERSPIESCGSDHQNYCFNHGKCMLLVDMNEHHCKCERGYYGHRCAQMELVFQPMKEEQWVLVAVCVVMLLIGMTGALYFFFKWYRRNKCPLPKKRAGYMGVERA